MPLIISPYGDLYNPLDTGDFNLEVFKKSVHAGLKKCDDTNYNTKCVKYDELNNFNELLFLINYLKEKDVKITVFLSPFEPTFFNHIAEYNNFLNYNKQIMKFFIDNNIKVVGSYNPNDYNLSSSYFIDGLHPTADAIKIIFKSKHF